MRHSRVWAIFAVITVLFVVGCGSGDGGSSTTSVSGSWTGTSTEQGVNRTTSTLQAQFLQNGTTITGSAVITGGGSATIGTVTGTIHGNQVTIAITTPAGNAAALRTDSVFGFNLPTWYATSAPFDLAKPLVVSVGGVVLTPSQYTVDTTTSALFSSRIYLPSPVPSSVIVQIQYYPYDPNPGVASTTNITGTAFGKSIAGTYTTVTSLATSAAQSGTFVLTRSTGRAPANITGVTIGGGATGK